MRYFFESQTPLTIRYGTILDARRSRTESLMRPKLSYQPALPSPEAGKTTFRLMHMVVGRL